MQTSTSSAPRLSPMPPTGQFQMQGAASVPPKMITDERRLNNYFPDEFLYSVQLDQEKLKCFYCWKTCPFCCCNEDLAQHTFMDVYSSGVIIAQPTGCCPCIARPARGVKVHFDDDTVFGKEAIKGECCCTPCPMVCTDCCGCCGEALVMQGGCGLRCCCVPSVGHRNECTTCNLLPCSALCLPISVMFGLKEGEADKVSKMLNEVKMTYLNGGNTWHHRGAEAVAAADGIDTRQPLGNTVVFAGPQRQQPMGGAKQQNSAAGGAYSSNNNAPYSNNAYGNPNTNPQQQRGGGYNNNQPVMNQNRGGINNNNNTSNNNANPRNASPSRGSNAAPPPATTFRVPDGDWQFDDASGMYWSNEQQLFLRTTDGHFYDPHSTQWYNSETGSWYVA